MLISIVTVNYNNIEGLKKTFESVQEQNKTLFEHIIIDGGSTDGSLEFIKSNESCFSYYVSEKDNGIYNGMNKGVKFCKGNYIFFLNSGDTFYSNNIISNVVSSNPIGDIIYGDINVILRSGLNRIIKMPEKLSVGITLNTTITHQAIFHKKSLFDNKGYSEDYKIISDWIFYNEAILFKKATYNYLNFTIANFESGGISSNIQLSEFEREKYLKSKFSIEFYDLLKEFNLLNLKYIYINKLFFVKYFILFKNYLKKLIRH
jgi:glycosyltransferase involved in cell wall biosynthesis